MKAHVFKIFSSLLVLTACSGPDPVCGDGVVAGTEACDDGNAINGDGCENDCTVTPPETTQTLFVDQLTDMKDAVLLVKEAAAANDLNRSQQQWRVLWQRAIKVRYVLDKLDATRGLLLFAPIQLHDNPALPGVHGLEAQLFGRTPNLAGVAQIADEMIVVIDELLAAPPTVTDEAIFRAALDAYRLPIEIFAGAESPLAGPDEEANRNLFISLNGYFDLIPDLLANAPALQSALDAVGQLVALTPDNLPPLVAAAETLEQTLAQTAQDNGLNVGVTPQDDFSQLTIPRQFGDNFTLDGNQAAIDLGKLLFFDPILSSPLNSRSCSSCHSPAKNFADNRAKGLALDGSDLPRNTPTVFNSALQVGSFWDSRVNDLPDQAIRPIEAAQEMGTDLVSVVNALNGIPEYVTRFNQVFTDGITANNLGRAIAAWEASSTVLLIDSPVDQYLQGNLNALNTSQKNGAEVFWGKGHCGNCHFAPIYGGTRAIGFNQTDLRVVGVPQDAQGTLLDPDLGKGGLAGASPIDNGAFKVPILRNLTQTAPYMHNGVFATLEEVINFYNAGGGPGLGLAVPNADPRMVKLNLTDTEKADLKAFLEALTDTTTPRPQAPAAVPSGLPVNGQGF